MNRWVAMLGIAAATSLGTGKLAAQNNSATPPDSASGNGGQGRQGRQGRGNFDPAQMQQRMMDNYKERLEITDDTEWKAIEPLDKQLEIFEQNFTRRGGKVLWAENTQQAIDEIVKICKIKNCKTLVKSKSMVTEEIHLNDAMKQHGIESIETDLGEYIQQLDGEAPYPWIIYTCFPIATLPFFL